MSSTLGGTATAGTDYTNTYAALTKRSPSPPASLEASTSPFMVTVTDDSFQEGAETVELNRHRLARPPARWRVTVWGATLVIVDDDVVDDVRPVPPARPGQAEHPGAARESTVGHAELVRSRQRPPDPDLRAGPAATWSSVAAPAPRSGSRSGMARRTRAAMTITDPEPTDTTTQRSPPGISIPDEDYEWRVIAYVTELPNSTTTATSRTRPRHRRDRHRPCGTCTDPCACHAV